MDYGNSNNGPECALEDCLSHSELTQLPVKFAQIFQLKTSVLFTIYISSTGY